MRWDFSANSQTALTKSGECLRVKPGRDDRMAIELDSSEDLSGSQPRQIDYGIFTPPQIRGDLLTSKKMVFNVEKENKMTSLKQDSEKGAENEEGQETNEAADRRNRSAASENLDATNVQENYKFWDRMGQVLDDDTITDSGVVTTLIVLARLMGEGEEVAIAQKDLAPLSRVSKRTLHKKIKSAEEHGYIETISKGHEGDINIYRAKGGWSLS